MDMNAIMVGDSCMFLIVSIRIDAKSCEKLLHTILKMLAILMTVMCGFRKKTTPTGSMAISTTTTGTEAKHPSAPWVVVVPRVVRRSPLVSTSMMR